jgi:hypothetical protein
VDDGHERPLAHVPHRELCAVREALVHGGVVQQPSVPMQPRAFVRACERGIGGSRIRRRPDMVAAADREADAEASRRRKGASQGGAVRGGSHSSPGKASPRSPCG